MAQTLESWLQLLHVLAATVWLGGGLVMVLVAARTRSSSNAQAMAAFARIIPFVGIRVLAPAMVLLLATGLAMVLISAAWSFTQPWVLSGLGLFAIAFLVGALFMSRAGIRLDRAARGDGPQAELPSLLRSWLLGYSVILAVLLVAMWDMVFKPGL